MCIASMQQVPDKHMARNDAEKTRRTMSLRVRERYAVAALLHDQEAPRTFESPGCTFRSLRLVPIRA
jgi:hypothetical protein